MLLSSRDNKDLLVVSFTDVRRCLESGFMDLDQQAEQAQQKQAASIAGHGSMQGQSKDPYNPGAPSQSNRSYQSNPASASTGAQYPSSAPSGNAPGGRGGLVTYPLPTSGSSTSLKNTSASFTPAGGRGGQGQRTGYQQQTPSMADYSYSQQSQFPPYNTTPMQSQPKYQQTNPYAQQGQGQGQQYASQQQQQPGYY